MRFTFIAAAMLLASPLSAEATDLKHFSPKAPKDLEAALVSLQEATHKMAEAVQASDMNQVHKLSYRLEAALEVLEEEVEEMQEQVEEIHEASEHAEDGVVQQTFEALQPKVTLLKNQTTSSFRSQ